MVVATTVEANACWMEFFSERLSLFFFLPFTIAFKVTSQFFPFLMLASAQLRFYQDFKGIFVKTTGLEFVVGCVKNHAKLYKFDMLCTFGS